MKNFLPKEERWRAARAIVEACPLAYELIHICMGNQKETVHSKAAREGWHLKSKTDEEAEREAASAAQLSWVSRAIDGVARVVARQIEELERSLGKEGVDDYAIKVSATLAKTLSAVEDLHSKIDKANNADPGEDSDILEIHRRIIAKIEAVAGPAEAEPVP